MNSPEYRAPHAYAARVPRLLGATSAAGWNGGAAVKGRDVIGWSRVGFVTWIFCAFIWAARCLAAEPVYPARSIQLIVPWAPGGGSDRVARILADGLQRRLGKPVIVVNRTGGSGAVGHSAGAMAPPDGYTLTLVTFELGTMKTLGISSVTWRDYTPVAQVNGDAAAIHVRADSSWKTLEDFLGDVRRKPGVLKMSGTATGGAWDLARAGLLLQSGIAVSNVLWTPAQGSAPALVELLGGHIDAVACSVPEASAQVSGGQVRVLGVMSAKRLQDFPELPTTAEQGVPYQAMAWRGLMAPKGTPQPIIDRLAAAVKEVEESKEFREFMSRNGFAIEYRGPGEFLEYVKAQESQWETVIRGAGFGAVGKNRDPGPYFFPATLATLFLLGFVVEWVRTRRESRVVVAVERPTQTNDEKSGGAGRRIWELPVALLIYLVALPQVGFAVATGVFGTVMMRRLGAPWWQSVIGTGVLVGGIHLLFVEVFHVPMP